MNANALLKTKNEQRKKTHTELSIIFHRHSTVAPKMLTVDRMHSEAMI